MEKQVILNEVELQLTLNRLCYQLIEKHDTFENTVLIGLQPRGIYVLERLIGQLEKILNKKIVCGNLDITFHKAFDDTPDWKASLENLIDCGINRVLTAGCNDHVIKGMSILKLMIEYARDRIEILPGGGLNDHNIDFFVKNIQPKWVHFSGCKKMIDRSTSNFESPLLKLDPGMIKHMIKTAKSQSFSIGAISSDI